MSKICSRCKTEFPATTEYFYKDRDRLRSICKGCHKASVVRYKLTHAGKLTHQRYRKKNKDKIKIRNRSYSQGEQGKAGRRKYCGTINGWLRNTYKHIKERCDSLTCESYHNYGGRGIKNKFSSSGEFVDYVMNNLKVDPRNLQIDRIDNDGHYEPGNIRFVTKSENCKNRKRK